MKEKKVRLALIATYPNLTKIVQDLANSEDVELLNIYASFEEAAEKAVEISSDVDVIMSRGGTAEYIRRAVSGIIPVISIPTTPYDVVSTVFEHGIRDTQIGLVTFKHNVHGLRTIEKMFNLIIYEYTFRNQWDIMEAVQDAKSKGLKTMIGGFYTVSIAKEAGLQGIEVASCIDSVERGFYESLQLVETQREERSIMERISVAFDALQEGVIITDENRVVTKINAAAESLLSIPTSAARNRTIDSLHTAINCPASFDSSNTSQNQLTAFGKATVVVNHYPVRLDNDFIGVASTFEDITKIQNLEETIRKKLYTKGFLAKYQFEDILTCSPKMEQLKALAEVYARINSPVLLEGESGTGKEMFAQSIHLGSQCAHGPFVAINCAAIPDQLLEAELFGYEAGAFTGARREGKPGMFELAHGGTIFLDEVGEIPLPLQASLLRAVQEREIMRVGGNKLIPVNIRIISATNRTLEQKVETGEFRRDLYYRLSVFKLEIPPLRERREDIPLITKSFVQSRGIDYSASLDRIMDILKRIDDYNWPGNIRELQNFLERACLLLKELDSQFNGLDILERSLNLKELKEAHPNQLSVTVSLDQGLKAAVAQVEQDIIRYCLEADGNDQQKAAERLGIGRTTLWRKLRERSETD